MNKKRTPGFCAELCTELQITVENYLSLNFFEHHPLPLIIKQKINLPHRECRGTNLVLVCKTVPIS